MIPIGLVAVECYSKKITVIVFKDGGGLTEIVDRFVSEDICDNYDKMQERFKYYEKKYLNGIQNLMIN